MISVGMIGTARHGMKPYSASISLVKTLAPAAPPRALISCRARNMWGASTDSPIIFSAK